MLVADTHDKAFAAIAEAPDFSQYQQLQEKNICIKNTIENAWSASGFSTEAGILQSQSTDPKESSRKHTTIMIVDDTSMTLYVEASILARAGFQVFRFYNVRQDMRQSNRRKTLG